MKKPLIGIVGIKEETTAKVPFYGNFVGYDYMKPLDKLGVNYIGIITNDEYREIDEEVLKLCDGFLIQGGSESKAYHYKILDYAYKNKVPVLGICLGCQMIGLYFSVEKKLQCIKEVTSFDHKPLPKTASDRRTTVHGVKLMEGTLLYKLFGPRLEVNSRHNYSIREVTYPLEIAAISDDGIIEAVELISKDQFMLGVQWHPEMIDEMHSIFLEFMKAVNKYIDSSKYTFN